MATQRVTMREAAGILGVSKEAVRKRVIRGTLRSEMGEDGRRYVFLDTEGDESPTHERDELISQMREEITYLRDENRRKDEIIMQQAISMQQLTAAAPAGVASEPAESPETSREQPGRVESQAPIEEPQEEPAEPAQRRSWWREFFGFE